MATDTVLSNPSGARGLSREFTEARKMASHQAAHEVGAIANMLRRSMDDSTDFDILLTGCLVRLDALSTALVLLAGSGAEKPAEIAEQYAIVFGEKLEVAHG